MNRVKARCLMVGLFLLVLDRADAQTCIQSNLSKKYNYKITRVIRHSDDKNGVYTDSQLIIEVSSKISNHALQKIVLSASYLMETAFKNCNSVRSYITGRNLNAEVGDYDFGDFIVVDLNFDGKEDLAVKVDSGGSGGPVYDFCIQNEKGVFIKNNYLSQKMSGFPLDIDSKHKILTIHRFMDYKVYQEISFGFNTKQKKWRIVSIKKVKL